MRLFSRVALCAAIVVTPLSSFAAEISSAPIRFVIPYEPGGGMDIMGRLVSEALSTALNQPVVPENRAGAGGIVGSQFVAHAPPDGHTLLLVSRPPVIIAPLMIKGLTFDPLKELAPVILLANVPALLLVKPSSPINTIEQLVAMDKANPGKLSYSSSGIGGTANQAALMLQEKTGVNALHVPYKGQGPANMAVMSGNVTMTYSDAMAGIPLVKSGQLKAVAITTPGRAPGLPDTPSIADIYPDYSVGVWYGVEAPAKTPKPIIDAINQAIAKGLKSPATMAKLAQLGVVPIPDTADQFGKFLQEEKVVWTKTFHDAGVKPE